MAPGGNEFDTPELKGINSGVDEAEDQIRDLEDKVAENTQSQKKKNNEESLRNIWDNISMPTLTLWWCQKEKKEQEIENLFEEMTENFLNLVKEIDIQVQEAQRVPNKIDTKRTASRHVIIKMQKN